MESVSSCPYTQSLITIAWHFSHPTNLTIRNKTIFIKRKWQSVDVIQQFPSSFLLDWFIDKVQLDVNFVLHFFIFVDDVDGQLAKTGELVQATQILHFLSQISDGIFSNLCQCNISAIKWQDGEYYSAWNTTCQHKCVPY